MLGSGCDGTKPCDCKLPFGYTSSVIDTTGGLTVDILAFPSPKESFRSLMYYFRQVSL